jgi:hypothetical protein
MSVTEHRRQSRLAFEGFQLRGSTLYPARCFPSTEMTFVEMKKKRGVA